MLPTMEEMEAWVRHTGGQAAQFLFRIALAILIYVILRKILKKFCSWLDKKFTKFGMDPSLKSFILSLTRYGTLTFAVITIIIKLHIVEASSIAALIASAGVGISLAVQGGLSNFTGGVLLLFLKPFRAGDYIIVQSEGYEGTVKKIEMYYTTLYTVDNKTVMIPNSSLTNNAVVNVTALPRRKLEVQIGVSYRTDIQKAKEILTNLLDQDERIAEDEREIYVDSLKESSIVLAFRAWVKTEDYWQAKWDMNERIKLAFDEAGIEIPYPQLDVHLKGRRQ
ncbi:MAG: mechanosensitive ion channel [Eubacterium sp.]|jgi:small conductance mechanosensitive channel|nr:mechanosensitive ion channel [Eubacterium sp.]MCH4045957.1 mechanosensitive ion channel [Eubacterium sp.]MCH4079051.1 mechanosensitive ion channel [Eubacterium sp.]MCH4111208.1 mechanosensitive ion channel [Eubacterium sp.]MCI1307993.1 mechanosensitive ion channel [Eubacterium sp.]